MHPTRLPKYRGPTSGAYVILNEEEFSGSTVHIMSEEFDKGDIILQSKVALSKFDTVKSMQRKVYSSEPKLLLKSIDLILNGFSPIPQIESEASEYPKLRTPDDSQIDPSKSLLELFNNIRASDHEEFPAHFFLNGEKVCIRLWRPNKKNDELDSI